MKQILFLLLLLPILGFSQSDRKTPIGVLKKKFSKEKKYPKSRNNVWEEYEKPDNPDLYKLRKGGKFIKKGSRKILIGFVIPSFILGIDYLVNSQNNLPNTPNQLKLYRAAGIIGVTFNVWGISQIGKGGRLIEESQAHLF